MEGVTLHWTNIASWKGVEILLVASCHRNQRIPSHSKTLLEIVATRLCGYIARGLLGQVD